MIKVGVWVKDLVRFRKPHKIFAGSIEAVTESCKLAWFSCGAPNADRVPNHCQRLASEAATESCKLTSKSHCLTVSKSQNHHLTPSPPSPLPKSGPLTASSRNKAPKPALRCKSDTWTCPAPMPPLPPAGLLYQKPSRWPGG